MGVCYTGIIFPYFLLIKNQEVNLFSQNGGSLHRAAVGPACKSKRGRVRKRLSCIAENLYSNDVARNGFPTHNFFQVLKPSHNLNLSI